MIALLPGSFKPVTVSHLQLVENLFKGNFKFRFEKETPTPVKEVIIVVSPFKREGKEQLTIGKNTVKKLWEYHLETTLKPYKENIKIIYPKTNTSPVLEVYRLIKENPSEKIYPVVGFRREDKKSIQENKRFDHLYKTHNRDVIVVEDTEHNGVSGTKVRKLLNELKIKEAVKYMGIKEETFLKTLDVNESMSGLPIAVTVPSGQRDVLIKYYEKLKEELPQELRITTDGLSITINPAVFNDNPLKENIENLSPLLITLITDFLEYIIKTQEYMLSIETLPEVNLIDDLENYKNPLGKTAFYEPSSKKISLYVTGRHPKDILRSFSHELVHHIQNIENRLPTMTSNNVHSGSEVEKIEQEAHYKGSMVLRKWEDSKNKPEPVLALEQNLSEEGKKLLGKLEFKITR